MNYRHEQKYLADKNIVAKLSARLNATMSSDIHSNDEGYYIRSLYFDDIHNSAFHEKESGDYVREKFRIRIYNGQATDIYLEKKMKVGNLSQKKRTKLSILQYEQIVSEDSSLDFDKHDNLLNEFLYKCKTRLLRPCQLVDYYRKAYVCSAGNVRITIDKNLSAPLSLDLFDVNGIRVPALSSDTSIIEVKYDTLFPDYLAQIIQMDFGRPQACSKYHLCRMAKNNITGV
jgi:hypothetical protein